MWIRDKSSGFSDCFSPDGSADGSSSPLFLSSSSSSSSKCLSRLDYNFLLFCGVCLFPGGWWGCAPVTLDVSSAVLKGRCAPSNLWMLLRTSETTPSHSTLCWPWPPSLRYTNTQRAPSSDHPPNSVHVRDVFALWFTFTRFWSLD